MNTAQQSSTFVRFGFAVGLVAALIITLTVVGYAPSQADAAKARNCGSITFKGDPYGSGGRLTSTGVKCKTARKLMLKCGRKGVKPSGWRAFFSLSSASLVLKRGNKRIAAQLAGGSPPGMDRCTS